MQIIPGHGEHPPKRSHRALRELGGSGVTVLAVSDLYETAAMGQTRQPPYLNAVALVATSLPAPSLLRLLKQIEVQAGRRGGRPWGMRMLDLDIIDYKGLRQNWAKAKQGAPRPAAACAHFAAPRARSAGLRAEAAARRRPRLAPSGAEGQRAGAVAARIEARPRPRAQAAPMKSRSLDFLHFALPGQSEAPK